MMAPGMRFLALSLLSLAAPAVAIAEAAAGAAASGEAMVSPAHASSTAEVAPPPAAPPVAASPATPVAARPPVVPTAALLEKLGKGDRLFLAGDHRNALFAYQDAVYLQPGYAPARVRLGRAYLALRYPEQAAAQAQAALAADPGNAEASELLASATAAPARPAAPDAPAAGGGHVFRLVPVGAPAPGEAAAAVPPPGPPPAR
jgi:tetratricopeptide (TPR) repeat protein